MLDYASDWYFASVEYNMHILWNKHMSREWKIYTRLKSRFCLAIKYRNDYRIASDLFLLERNRNTRTLLRCENLHRFDVRPQKSWERQPSRFLHNEQLARAFYQFRLSAVGNKRIYSRVFWRMKMGVSKEWKIGGCVKAWPPGIGLFYNTAICIDYHGYSTCYGFARYAITDTPISRRMQ